MVNQLDFQPVETVAQKEEDKVCSEYNSILRKGQRHPQVQERISPSFDSEQASLVVL